MKKLCILVLVLLICTTGIAFAADWDLEGTIFPLEETAHYTILTSGTPTGDIDEIDENKDWTSLLEAANVDIDFIYLGSNDEGSHELMQTRLLGEDYGDAIWGFGYDTLSTEEINEMGEANMAVDLTPYLTDSELMPNFNNAITEDLLRHFKATDGKIYGMRSLDQTTVYTAHEGRLQVNVAWMEQWQKATGTDHAPVTIEEFQDMLVYFRDNDMNGNGDPTDETPYFIALAGFWANATLEHSMGSWGIATKDSALDMNIQVDDEGNCYFVHTTDAYRAALEQFAAWYKEGLIYSDCFTANADTTDALFSDAENKVGAVNMCYDADGFESILPYTVEGYTPRVFVHPGVRTGVDNPKFVLTDKCENPDILMAFMDLFYNPKNSVRALFGSMAFEEQGYASEHADKEMLVSIGEDGKIYFQNPGEIDRANVPNDIAMIYKFIEPFRPESMAMLEKYYDMASYLGDTPGVRGGELYIEAGVLNHTENIWGRYTLLPDDQDDYTFMYADASATLAEYRAAFASGRMELTDENWAAFQEQLKSNGIEEMTEMVQRAYDAALAQ